MTKNTTGCLIIDVAGKELTQEDKELLTHPAVGGVILFTRNFENRTQLKALTSSIKHSRSSPLLIMTDQEGGRVQRFKSDFTLIPAMGELGELYNRDPTAACEQAIHYGALMSGELLSAQVDLGLSPVLDLNKPISTVIGNRAFHADPHIVCELSRAFMQGMRQAGMAAVGKHFPGHGSVSADSHVALPYDNRSYHEIEQSDLIPFAAAIRNNIPAIMVAHIVVPEVDSLQVGYSSVWLRKILRNQLQFNGVIFSDDLNMSGAAISNSYEDRVIAAREAGCDFALLCNNRLGVIQAVDKLKPPVSEVGKEKWQLIQGRSEVI